jgi:hypothetical protein
MVAMDDTYDNGLGNKQPWKRTTLENWVMGWGNGVLLFMVAIPFAYSDGPLQKWLWLLHQHPHPIKIILNGLDVFHVQPWYPQWGATAETRPS